MASYEELEAIEAAWHKKQLNALTDRIDALQYKILLSPDFYTPTKLKRLKRIQAFFDKEVHRLGNEAIRRLVVALQRNNI
jgi:hypothetical protein